MNITIHCRTIYHIHHAPNCFAVKVLSNFITIKFAGDIHRNTEDLQYAQQLSNTNPYSNSGYRHPQQEQNLAMYLQQSSSSMLRPPMSTMHQQERKYTGKFPMQRGVTRFDRQANVVRFPEQVDGPRVPRQADVARFPGQTGGARFPEQANVARFPPHTDVARFPGQTDIARFPGHTDFARFPGQTGVARCPGQMGVTRFPGQAGDSTINQHTQQISPHVQYQPQTLQNIQNRTHTEDTYMFHPSYIFPPRNN